MAVDPGYLYDLLRKLGLSDFAARTGAFLLMRPLKIILVVVIAALVARAGARAVRRAVLTVRNRSPLSSPRSVRGGQRASTLGDVLASCIRAGVWSIAFLIILDEVGINLAPLIAGAGIAGVAIGFGAQSLVRDVISGLFILLEDQYGVGDIVTLGDTTGTVEDLSLRVTRLRSADGTVWFVPNGEVRRIGNSSMEWSQALIDVVVAHDADVDEVQRVLLEEARAFAVEPEWSASILEPPAVVGVQGIDEKGVRIRVLVKTAPGQHGLIARELRVRLLKRLTQHQIALLGA
jgi:small conductance mechanosensitive channel